MKVRETPLQIKTDSTLGSGDIVSVEFITMDVYSAGGFKLHFTNPMTYELMRCTTERQQLKNVPVQRDKTWTFNRVSKRVMRIDCNDVDVAQFEIDNCHHSENYVYHERKMERFRFEEPDTASDFYRQKGQD